MYEPAIALKLYEEIGSAKEIFSLSHRELSLLLGLRKDYIIQILSKKEVEPAEKEIEWSEKSGITTLTIDDDNYPSRLKECPDAPLLLYYKGLSNLNSKRMISIVGTRKASDYGRSQCREIVKTFSHLKEKPVIISGLAYGIDITAHLAALDYGVETIAIMATGLDRIYPSHHRSYAVKIVKSGGIISDFPSGTAPVPLNFLKRNRIIAGMADAVILIESKIKGGGMNTASLANSYSREVYALPGKITDKNSAGCNFLISKNIAQSIYSPESIIKQLGWEDKKSRNKETTLPFCDDNFVKTQILTLLAKEKNPLDFDEISLSTQIPVGEVMATLLEMEMEERVVSMGRNKYVLN